MADDVGRGNLEAEKANGDCQCGAPEVGWQLGWTIIKHLCVVLYYASSYFASPETEKDGSQLYRGLEFYSYYGHRLRCVPTASGVPTPPQEIRGRELIQITIWLAAAGKFAKQMCGHSA